jgi:hypothetical protein
MVIVVSGHEDDFGPRDRLADHCEERGRPLQGLGDRPIAKLDDVPEQDKSLGSLEDGRQQLAEDRPPEQVVAGPGAEMEIGDDDGPGHGRI